MQQVYIGIGLTLEHAQNGGKGRKNIMANEREIEELTSGDFMVGEMHSEETPSDDFGSPDDEEEGMNAWEAILMRAYNDY